MSISNEEFKRLYGRPPVKKKKVKIYWNRIIIALVIVILIIFGISQAVKGLIKHFKDDDNVAAVAASQTDITSSKQEKSTNEANLQFKVCLDPGHGDYDVGTTSLDGSRLEKDDNLVIALKVRDCLEEAGAVVVMTREDDTFLSLEERCQLANRTSSDLFVSLHRNSYDGDISGVEVWVHNKEPEKDTTLAQNIMNALDETDIADNRGVQYGYVGLPNDNYYVNAETKMPSCLLEMGFLTDETDNKLFDENIDSYAQAIANGIIQSAKDLQVIDDNGKRILNEQLITEEKDYSSKTDDNASSEDDTSRLVYNDGEQEYYR
ncbi:MAG: N-acetylmuramoyl-L-alanine amidase [Ruminococcus sp.]|nr:N-acetylmuramoyl-L-alanine amidase [Ruminococcus sp.]